MPEPEELPASNHHESLGSVPLSVSTMTLPMLRSPRQRVGILPNADIPPPDGSIPKGLAIEPLLRKALVERDPEAFRRAFQDFGPEMLAQARSHVRSQDDAQDVVQDTWLAALRGIHRFQGRSSLQTWLLRILRNRASTAGTRSRRLVPASQLEGDGQLAEMDIERLLASVDPINGTRVWTPEEIDAGSRLSQILRDALAALPHRQREVLVFRDVDGHSAQETEERLGLTPENQRVLLHRARKRLRHLVSHRWV